jgi:site-specific DNA recombinase
LPDSRKITVREAWTKKDKYRTRISDLQARLTYLREMLSTQKIEPEDYRKMKAEYTEKIEKLLEKLASSSQTPVDFGYLLNSRFKTLINLEHF